MKKLLLAVLILAGCQPKSTNRVEINGQVIEGENITIRSIEDDTAITKPYLGCDTVYIHDTVKVKVTVQSPQNVVTHGDNSPAIISDKPVNIKY